MSAEREGINPSPTKTTVKGGKAGVGVRKFLIPNSKFRIGMMAGSSDEPSQNVIPTEGRHGPRGGIWVAGGRR